MMDEEEQNKWAQETDDLEKALSACLAGNRAEVVGAALSQMVAFYLLGHHPSIRPGIKQDWLDLLEKLLELDVAAADAAHRRGQN